MKRPLTLVIGAFVLGLLLSACSLPEGATSLRFSLSDDGALGYEVNEQGQIVIKSRNLRFWNPPGAFGLTVLRYRIVYFDQNGIPFNIDDGGGEDPPPGILAPAADHGPVGLYVPAGVQCTAPHEVLGCRIGDPGWRFAPGVEAVSPQGFQLMPGGLAVLHVLLGFPVGWYAEIEFDVVDAVGRAWTTPVYRLTITVPN